jgi:hypothetical protein
VLYGRAIEPILAPLIHGHDSVLSHDDQLQLAAWSWKVALVGESLRGASKQVPDDEYHRFFLERRPPPGERIDLLHYIGGSFRHGFNWSDLTETHAEKGPVTHAVLVTVIIEQLILQTHVPVTGLVQVLRTIGDDRVSIWPAMLQSVTWPPDLGIDDDALRVVTAEEPGNSS